MIGNYMLNFERAQYNKHNEPIADRPKIGPINEAVDVNDFINSIPDEQLSDAIRNTVSSNKFDTGTMSGILPALNGKKVRITLRNSKTNPGEYEASFEFVENKNVVEDLADAIDSAIRWYGTNNELIYAIAAAYRGYCQDTGKDEFVEMFKIRQKYSEKYGKGNINALYQTLTTKLRDDLAENTELCVKNLYLMGSRSDVGVDRANRLADTSKPAVGAEMLQADANDIVAIEYLLACPLQTLRAINDTFKSRTQSTVADYVKTSKFTSDIKDMVNYYLMAAGSGLYPKDDTYNKVASMIIDGTGQEQQHGALDAYSAGTVMG